MAMPRILDLNQTGKVLDQWKNFSGLPLTKRQELKARQFFSSSGETKS